MSGRRLSVGRHWSSKGGQLYSSDEIALTGFDVMVVYAPPF
jgi:hypothetical protein